VYAVPALEVSTSILVELGSTEELVLVIDGDNNDDDDDDDKVGRWSS